MQCIDESWPPIHQKQHSSCQQGLWPGEKQEKWGEVDDILLHIESTDGTVLGENVTTKGIVVVIIEATPAVTTKT
jgi:hypothetical protein